MVQVAGKAQAWGGGSPAFPGAPGAFNPYMQTPVQPYVYMVPPSVRAMAPPQQQ